VFLCWANHQTPIICQNQFLATLSGFLIGAFDFDARGKSSAEFEQMMTVMHQGMTIVN
jgi:hypothetical protein